MACQYLVSNVRSTVSLVVLLSSLEAPVIRPGWFPFYLRTGQSIVWPSDPPGNAAIEVQAIRELVVACRVDGRPKAEVTWLFNGVDIQSALNSSVNITEITQGRSVATINVGALQDVLRGENTIVCQAENFGGSTAGTIVLQGICKHILPLTV